MMVSRWLWLEGMRVHFHPHCACIASFPTNSNWYLPQGSTCDMRKTRCDPIKKQANIGKYTNTNPIFIEVPQGQAGNFRTTRRFEIGSCRDFSREVLQAACEQANLTGGLADIFTRGVGFLEIANSLGIQSPSENGHGT